MGLTRRFGTSALSPLGARKSTRAVPRWSLAGGHGRHSTGCWAGDNSKTRRPWCTRTNKDVVVVGPGAFDENLAHAGRMCAVGTGGETSRASTTSSTHPIVEAAARHRAVVERVGVDEGKVNARCLGVDADLGVAHAYVEESGSRQTDGSRCEGCPHRTTGATTPSRHATAHARAVGDCSSMVSHKADAGARCEAKNEH